MMGRKRQPSPDVQYEDGRLRLRVVFAPDIVLGPGKADLLEGIRDTGSISAAGRRMKMSYKRAWDLVDALNHYFTEPVIHTSKGGSGGGGASLTEWGEQVLAAYRAIEARSAEAVAGEIALLREHLRSSSPTLSAQTPTAAPGASRSACARPRPVRR